MNPIIEPVDRSLLEAELNETTFVRNTNKGNNKIFIINNKNAPNTMLEIGRLREITFRAAGGGTGESYDIDNYDTDDICYEQLIVYSPEDQEIVGGYRYICCGNAFDKNTSEIHLSTSKYFDFSETFKKNYLPLTIELGRSWVQPKFQPAVNPRKGLFALDNIWDGLGALIIENKNIKYFFGKVTMYTHYNQIARDMILHFLHKYFPDNENLLKPFHDLPIKTDQKEFEKLFASLDYKDAFKILNQSVRNLGENIPPLVNIYMNLSPTMKTFGTAANPHFGDVEETGIMVTIADIYDEKKLRHIASYQQQ
jgi:hypothetical protein